MARMGILFDGFSDLAASIDAALGTDALHQAVDDALTETGKYIQKQLTAAASPYARKGGGRKGYATGEMYKTIKKDQMVYWNGNVAEVSVGFDLTEDDGWVSIFVMYGTPRMAKDTKIYNAIKGAQTQREVAKIQQEVMSKYITVDYAKR